MPRNLLLSAVFLCALWASAAAGDEEALLEALFVESGMDHQVSQLGNLIRTDFDEAIAAGIANEALPPGLVPKVRDALKLVFAPEPIKATLVAEWQRTLDGEDLQAVLDWLRSPIGRECTRLEAAASSPLGYLDMQQFATDLVHAPPSRERTAILREIDAVTKMTETTVEVAMNTQLAVVAAITDKLPRDQGTAYDQVAALIERDRPRVEVAAREETLVSLLFTYRSLSDDELRRLLAFARSAPGARYYEASAAGLGKAILDGTYAMGEVIAASLGTCEQGRGTDAAGECAVR